MRSTRSVQAVKDACGGEIPNKLFLQKRERLSDLIFDFSGERPDEDTPIKDLVAQIIELTKTTQVVVPLPQGTSHELQKRKADGIEDGITTAVELVNWKREHVEKVKLNSKTKTVKIVRPRWALDSLDPLNLAEMKRILFISTIELSDRYTAKDLILTWDAIGMQTQYPTGWEVSKMEVVQKMRIFAGNNLLYHKVDGVTQGDREDGC